MIRRFALRDNRYVTRVISTNNFELNSFYRREKLFAIEIIQLKKNSKLLYNRS